MLGKRLAVSGPRLALNRPQKSTGTGRKKHKLSLKVQLQTKTCHDLHAAVLAGQTVLTLKVLAGGTAKAIV